MRTLVRPAVVLFLLLSLVTGLAYPLAVTGAAWVLFPFQAGGSLLGDADQPAGSALIGQPFADPGHFWGRPSATGPKPYDALASGGSNLGPRNPALAAQVRARIEQLRRADPGQAGPVPLDLVTASGSGLDPHISPAAARFQLARVARARALPEAVLAQLVERCTEGPDWGLFGEPRVNVLRLNLALDATARPGC